MQVIPDRNPGVNLHSTRNQVKAIGRSRRAASPKQDCRS